MWSNQPVPTQPDLRASLGELLAALEPIAAAGGAPGGQARDVVDRLRQYALRRLDEPQGRWVIAVSGLTGVGKSTLVNALAGADLSPVGPIRPTTTSAVRVTADSLADPGPLLDVATLVDLPPGPGLDLAKDADLHLFVTTPARYADAEGWDHLAGLTERAIPTWVVLVRTEDGDDVVAADLRRRLEAAGIEAPLAVLPDIAEDPGAVGDLAAGLTAGAAESPGAVDAARIAALVEEADAVAAGMRRSAAIAEDLALAVDDAYRPVEVAAMGLGAPEGEVAAVPGAPTRPWADVVPRLALVLTHRIAAAAESAATQWSSDTTGARLLEGDGTELWRHGPTTSAVARERLLDWPSEVEQLVAVHAPQRRWWQRHTPPEELAALVRNRALGGTERITRRERKSLGIALDEIVDQGRGRWAGWPSPRSMPTSTASWRNWGSSTWSGSPGSSVPPTRCGTRSNDRWSPMRDLQELFDAVDLVIGAAAGVAPEESVTAAAQAMRHLRGRRGYHGATLVVALGGGTGSGKSSLLNAIAGERIATVGRIRPTTERPLAWVPASAGDALDRLLDDLGIEDRHLHDRDPGVAMIDLPDMDSIALSHRELVERMTGEVDALLWVLDPDKYHDHILHEDFLAPLAAHAEQTVFVLNKIDRIEPAARGRCSPRSRTPSSPTGTRTRACSQWPSTPAMASPSGWRPWCSSSRPSSTTSGLPTASWSPTWRRWSAPWRSSRTCGMVPPPVSTTCGRRPATPWWAPSTPSRRYPTRTPGAGSRIWWRPSPRVSRHSARRCAPVSATSGSKRQ